MIHIYSFMEDTFIRVNRIIDRTFFFFVFFFKTYIKMYMSPIEELSCWDVCMMMVSSSPSHTRSEQEMHQGRPLLSLFLSFFYNGRSLILSLSRRILIQISIFFSPVLFIASIHTADVRPNKDSTYYGVYISSSGRAFVFFFLFVYASKNSCLSCSMIGCNLTASSDEKKDGEKNGRTQKNLSLALLFFFVIRLPRACRSLLQGMWYMLCTIMM